MTLVKAHVKLPHVRLALPEGTRDAQKTVIRTVALCAGSGGSVLGGVPAGVSCCVCVCVCIGRVIAVFASAIEP